jgi:hypothetical protein
MLQIGSAGRVGSRSLPNVQAFSSVARRAAWHIRWDLVGPAPVSAGRTRLAPSVVEMQIEPDRELQRDYEPISPELVLIDPSLRELAFAYEDEARERLASARASAGGVDEPSTPLEPPVEPRVRRRSGRLLVRAVAGTAVAAMGLLFLLGASERRTASSAPREASAVVPKADAVRIAKTTVTGSGPLRWRSAAAATFYDVVLVYRGTRVLDLWPRTPAVSLSTLRAHGRHLRPGRYRWFVYPGYGNWKERAGGATFYGSLIAEGTLSIPARERG